MKYLFSRRTVMSGITAAALSLSAGGVAHAQDDNIVLRMSTPASATDQRSVALEEAFGPAVSEFADYQPSYNGTLFQQGTELEAIARGNLEMSITSAQELATIFPEFSIFTAGYLHRDAQHQIDVFNADFMEPLKQKVEEELGVKLLTVMYLGKRHVNIKGDREVMTPEDLDGVQLRMPNTDAWQFLGSALGADPVPLAFTEVYTALQTGAIDGQDNPLPTVRDAKFYEVTDQIILTSHLVDLNYLAFSKEVWDGLTPEQQQTVQEAADAAADLGRERQLELESELASFMEEQGLKVYEPDLEAFRTRVQEEYLNSEFAADWPEGMLEKINALD